MASDVVDPAAAAVGGPGPGGWEEAGGGLRSLTRGGLGSGRLGGAADAAAMVDPHQLHPLRR